MPRRTVILFAAAISGIALALALVTVLVVGARERAAPAQGMAGTSIQAGGTGQAQVGGPFTMTDQDGRQVTEQMLEGRWSLVFFGFTYCPDVCPTTMQVLGAAQQQLGPKADKFQVVFISVDPERDTPEQIKTYLSNEVFPKGTIGLTGTPEQVAAAAKAYRVYYKKNGEGSDYLIDHSTPAYLMNPKGQFDRVLPYGISPEETTRQIADAMR